MTDDNKIYEIVPSPSDALKYYRRISPMLATEQVTQFIAMPISDQLELLFYMCIYQSSAVASIGDKLGIEFQSLKIPEEN